MIKKLRLSDIRVDGDTQPRVKIDNATVAEYAEEIRNKKKFPPLEVYHDGSSYWLTDGFHRFFAYSREDISQVDAEIIPGDVWQARWASLAKNQAHGLRRTNEDKRRAVEIALKIKPELTSHAIADHCGVSHTFVDDFRKKQDKNDSHQLATVANSTSENEAKRIGKDGKSYPAPSETPKGRKADTMRPEKTLSVKDIMPRCNEEFGCCQCDKEGCGKRQATFGNAVECKTKWACSEFCPRIGDPPARAAGFPPAPPPEEPEEPKAPPVSVDSIGRPVPSAAMETWTRRHEAQELLRKVSDLRSAVQKAQDTGDILWREIHLNDMRCQLDNLYQQLKPLVPYTVCPGCQGLDQCRLCNGRRMISKFKWDTVVTERQKELALNEAKKLSEKCG